MLTGMPQFPTLPLPHSQKNIMKKETLGLILGPALFVVVILFVPLNGMPAPAKGVLASTLWVATWWITEALPIPATALLPLVLFPMTGGLDIEQTASAYGNPLIFLFIGGFMIALAIERWNLHRRIALNVIRHVGESADRLILGFMLSTALLSMWISNTATSMMMMPIALALIKQRGGRRDKERDHAFARALMLAIAYSASIGGLATLIGTPTNIIFSGIARELYGVDIAFADWFWFGLPMTVVLLFICWLYLTKAAFPTRVAQREQNRAEIGAQLRKLGRMSFEERCVLAVFFFVALAWIGRSLILSRWLPGVSDPTIAICGTLLLFLIPSRESGRTRLLDWQTAAKLPWGIVLLFGGGLALASGFRHSGLAEWLGGQMSLVSGAGLFGILFLVVALVNFLTEVTSNVATASMFLPILAAMAAGLGIHPYGLMVGACVAASCAFMLPVATPPNAVVFGSGYLRMQDMVRVGLCMNIFSIVFVTLYVYFVLPLIWGINLNVFPKDL